MRRSGRRSACSTPGFTTRPARRLRCTGRSGATPRATSSPGSSLSTCVPCWRRRCVESTGVLAGCVSWETEDGWRGGVEQNTPRSHGCPSARLAQNPSGCGPSSRPPSKAYLWLVTACSSPSVRAKHVPGLYNTSQLYGSTAMVQSCLTFCRPVRTFCRPVRA